MTSSLSKHCCVSTMNEHLYRRNCKLATGFSITDDGKEARDFLLLKIEKIDRSKRGMMPAVAVTYCPFCGERLINDGDGLRSLKGTTPEDPFDFVEHLQRQRAFSENTFGPGARVAAVCDHIEKELTEVREGSGALDEWIDVVILGLDGCWRSGASPEQIIAALVAKQAKNEARTWPDWRTADPDKAIEHVREDA